MSKKKRKSYSREFKVEAVRLIAKKGYSIAEASRNLGVEYSTSMETAAHSRSSRRISRQGAAQAPR